MRPLMSALLRLVPLALAGSVVLWAAPVTTPAGAATVTRQDLGVKGVGNARQVVIVDASGYGRTTATLTAWTKTSSGWVRVYGPMTAHIGRTGFATPGGKREGDGHSPAGSYGFTAMFGVAGEPSGVRYPWLGSSRSDVWDDDSHSARYNEWTDTTRASAGHSPEPLDVSPQYDEAAVIGYNTARTPGMGSAIFLHVTDGQATSGCVAIPRTAVERIMTWLRPTYDPVIIMGTSSEISS